MNKVHGVGRRLHTSGAVSFRAHITLTEVECRALDALVGYGADAFIKALYNSLGAAYMQEHEEGLKSFFEAARRDVLPALKVINQAGSLFRRRFDIQKYLKTPEDRTAYLIAAVEEGDEEFLKQALEDVYMALETNTPGENDTTPDNAGSPDEDV
jgi:hypothetical protein